MKKIYLFSFFFTYSFISFGFDLKIMSNDMHRYETPGIYNSDLLFQNIGIDNIRYFQLKWSLNNILIGTQNVDIQSTWSSPLQPSDAFSNYFFPLTINQSLPLLTEGEYEFKIWIENVHNIIDENQLNDTIAYRIHVVDYLPEKHVLLETYTHITCGPCYTGDLNLELLLNSNQNLSAVCIHNSFNDPMSFPDGSTLDAYFSSAHPNFVFDRFQFEPFSEYGSMILFDGTSIDLNKRFEMKEGLEVSITEEIYDPISRQLSITLKADFYANYMDSLAWNVWVLEDSIFGYQANAPDPNNYYHNHVARSILGGLWGEALTQPLIDGSTHYKTFIYTLPANFSVNHIHVIGFIQRNDDSKKEIINSTNDLLIKEHYLGALISKIEQPIKLYPNPTNGVIEIKSDFQIKQVFVYDNSGRLLLETTENILNLFFLKNGNYLIKIETESGISIVPLVKT